MTQIYWNATNRPFSSLLRHIEVETETEPYPVVDAFDAL